MVSEGINRMRYAEEISELMTKYFNEIPPSLHIYNDGKERR